MRVLLVGGAGSLLGPVVAAALRRAGASVIRGHPDFDVPLHSRHYADYLPHPALSDASSFQEFLLDYAGANGDVVLLPFDDGALVALQPIRAELDQLMSVAAAPYEPTAIALDKSRTLEAAARLETGLCAPATIVPTSAEDAVARWTGPWPVIVKPRTGAGAEGIRLARNADELRASYALVASAYDRPLVQMAIQYEISRKFGLFYLFDGCGRLRSWYGQRLEAEQHAIGVGGTGTKIAGGIGLLWQSWFDRELLERGRHLLQSIGWRGLAFIEGAYDERDGKPYIFEINARLGGTQALSLKEGVNFVHDACLVAVGRTPPERLRFRTGVRAKRDPFALLKTGDPALMLRMLDPTRVSSIPGLADPRPVVESIWRRLAKRLRPRG